jgi:hypothetical protein
MFWYEWLLRREAISNSSKSLPFTTLNRWRQNQNKSFLLLFRVAHRHDPGGGGRKRKSARNGEKENPRWAREAEALTERRLEKNPFLSLMNRSRRIFHFSSLFRIFFLFYCYRRTSEKSERKRKKTVLIFFHSSREFEFLVFEREKSRDLHWTNREVEVL